MVKVGNTDAIHSFCAYCIKNRNRKWKADFGVFHNFSIFQTQKYVQSINLNSLNMKQKIKITIFNWSDIFITLRKLLATWNIWPLLIIYLDNIQFSRQNIFRALIFSFQTDKFTFDQMQNYQMSVIEREVNQGVVNVDFTKFSSLAFLRRIDEMNMSDTRGG